MPHGVRPGKRGLEIRCLRRPYVATTVTLGVIAHSPHLAGYAGTQAVFPSPRRGLLRLPDMCCHAHHGHDPVIFGGMPTAILVSDVQDVDTLRGWDRLLLYLQAWECLIKRTRQLWGGRSELSMAFQWMCDVCNLRLYQNGFLISWQAGGFELVPALAGQLWFIS